LKGATGKAVENPDFDEETSALIDRCQVALNPEQVLKAAKALKLDTDCTPPPKNETSKPLDVPTDEPPPATSSATRASVPGVGLITAATGLSTALMNRLLNRNPIENA